MGCAELAAARFALALDEGVWAVFREFDKNGDGKIDANEYGLEKVRVLALRDADGDKALSPEESLAGPDAFRAADQNGDGLLSGLEWITAPFTDFAFVDTDSDQTITPEEFEAFVQAVGKK